MSDYYNSCAVPKPQNGKRKKKCNGYKDKPNRHCYYTGKPYAERHELFFGNPLRQISIDNGFQVDICPEIHRLFHGITEKAALEKLQIPGMLPDPIAWAEVEVKELRKECQERYEEREQIELGFSQEQARSSWMKLIGENYID